MQRNCAIRTYVVHRIQADNAIDTSAANDYWGKTFLKLSGEKKMNQQLAVLTGSAAGATESFVVVPFELVKIKCVCAALKWRK